MNTDDIVDYPVPDDINVKASNIYDRQSQLESKYVAIEKRESEFILVNTRYGQKLIKDFLWRITEEVGEALEAISLRESEAKVHEELADGLHFVTGLFVVLQKKELYVEAWKDYMDAPLREFQTDRLELLILALSKTGNCLKMKPWKQTDVETDEKYFDKCLHDLIYCYLNYCYGQNMDLYTMYNIYMKKSEVNLFRIRSKY